ATAAIGNQINITVPIMTPMLDGVSAPEPWKIGFVSPPAALDRALTQGMPLLSPAEDADGSADAIRTGAIRAGVFSSVAIPIGGLAARERWQTVFTAVRRANFSPCGDASCPSAESRLAAAVSVAGRQGFSA